MDAADLLDLLDAVRAGDVAPGEAAATLARPRYADLGFAKVDHQRAVRQGVAEAVYGPGKTPHQCAAIVAELLAGGDAPVLLTRASPDQIAAATAANPDATATGTTVMWRPAGARPERVAVVTAGTADQPVADECGATLAAYGVTATRVADVGVAGLHRLLDRLDELTDVHAVVVAAGMEGALASVVGGLVAAPVVAVPTSTGYGAGLEGVTALLAMHASCAAGVTVVGIDNGFGAACAVARIIDVRARRG